MCVPNRVLTFTSLLLKTTPFLSFHINSMIHTQPSKVSCTLSIFAYKLLEVGCTLLTKSKLLPESMDSTWKHQRVQYQDAMLIIHVRAFSIIITLEWKIFSYPIQEVSRISLAICRNNNLSISWGCSFQIVPHQIPSNSIKVVLLLL